MKRILLSLLMAMFLGHGTLAQETTEGDGLYPAKDETGTLSVGLRTTGSFFGNEGNIGMGVGGQFRLHALRWMNTEWFADYITTDIDGLATRTDAHIGWSVLFYPFKTKKPIIPYLMAGQCFDYTMIETVRPIGSIQTLAMETNPSRWSAATQAGMGCHFRLHRVLDLSLSAQYMMHLGKDLHVHVEDGAAIVEEHDEFTLEGHLLVTASINVRIADLWESKK